MDKEEIRKARAIWNEDNSKPYQAYLQIERINCIEKFLLNGLSQSDKNDYLGAFQFVRFLLHFLSFLLSKSSSHNYFF